MDKRHELGKEGEDYALEHIVQKGYSIVGRNITFENVGEIDIIAKKDDILVFIEVRTRAAEVFGLPVETVDFFKQKKFLKAVSLYLEQLDITEFQEIRMDIVSIVKNRDDNVNISHYQGCIENSEHWM
ncbi:MAG: YraN family protein [Deltaproteobacteria bacterium]|nr:YraN family protein [Deltaproteobacteria bacterium]